MFNDGFNGGGVMEDLVIAISMFGYTFIVGVVIVVIYENLKRRK
jgi:hypothetical protein